MTKFGWAAAVLAGVVGMSTPAMAMESHLFEFRGEDVSFKVHSVCAHTDASGFAMIVVEATMVPFAYGQEWRVNFTLEATGGEDVAHGKALAAAVALLFNRMPADVAMALNDGGDVRLQANRQFTWEVTNGPTPGSLAGALAGNLLTFAGNTWTGTTGNVWTEYIRALGMLDSFFDTRAFLSDCVICQCGGAGQIVSPPVTSPGQ
jgi:hypothetical protein